jgi:hypothetical protein
MKNARGAAVDLLSCRAVTIIVVIIVIIVCAEYDVRTWYTYPYSLN